MKLRRFWVRGAPSFGKESAAAKKRAASLVASVLVPRLHRSRSRGQSLDTSNSTVQTILEVDARDSVVGADCARS